MPVQGSAKSAQFFSHLFKKTWHVLYKSGEGFSDKVGYLINGHTLALNTINGKSTES